MKARAFMLLILALAMGCQRPTDKASQVSSSVPVGEVSVGGRSESFEAATTTDPRLPVPRIAWVAPLGESERVKDPGEIWSDDFDTLEPKEGYFESEGENSAVVALGDVGRSMRLRYPKGEAGSASRKIMFGDCPIGNPVRKGEVFTDVYWRFYLFHPRSWQGGGPEKLSRIISFASNSWDQAFIVHVWDEQGGLTLDPASGVKDDKVVTTAYNDFPNLTWLGNQPASGFPFYTDELGRWVLVGAEVRLNTPGEADGYAALWIDGELRTERKSMNLRGRYQDKSINSIFLEGYWNNGSPVEQSRYVDNFIVSTRPIGPLVARADALMKFRGDDAGQAWEVQIATRTDSGRHAEQVVWHSDTLLEPQTTVSPERGRFLDGVSAKLRPGTYVVRIRQKGSANNWSEWSPWHQPFRIQVSVH